MTIASGEPAVATSVNQVGRELKFLLPPDDHPCIRRGTLKFGSGAYLDGLRIPTFWNRDTGVCRSRHKADKAESSDCKCSSTACAFALCCVIMFHSSPPLFASSFPPVPSIEEYGASLKIGRFLFLASLSAQVRLLGREGEKSEARVRTARHLHPQFGLIGSHKIVEPLCSSC